MTLPEIERACAAVDGVVFDFGGVFTVSPGFRFVKTEPAAAAVNLVLNSLPLPS